MSDTPVDSFKSSKRDVAIAPTFPLEAAFTIDIAAPTIAIFIFNPGTYGGTIVLYLRRVSAKNFGPAPKLIPAISNPGICGICGNLRDDKLSDPAIEGDEESKQFITNNPFGGIHILLTGDLYQLKPIGGTPIFNSRESDKMTCTRGRAIWHSMTDYIELTEACRYLDGNASVLAKFLTAARKGIVHEDILVIINERYKMSVEETISLANEKAIWMANTKKEVENINNMCFNNLTQNGKLSYRIVAEHIPSKALIPFPDEQTKEELYKYEDDSSPSYIDLAIGSRVSINKNLATQIGCYNGALGTVRGSNNIKNINYCK